MLKNSITTLVLSFIGLGMMGTPGFSRNECVWAREGCQEAFEETSHDRAPEKCNVAKKECEKCTSDCRDKTKGYSENLAKECQGKLNKLGRRCSQATE